MSRSILIQAFIWRAQRQGSLQSSNITKSVSGIDSGVKSGFRSGAKTGEDSERKYVDSLASVSWWYQLCSPV